MHSAASRSARHRRELWPALWRRRPVLVAVMSVAVGLVLWIRLRTPLGTDHDRYHNRVFTCVHVLDGDTLELACPDGRSHTTRVRLLGLDAPEIAHGDRPAMHFGPEAAAFTRSLVDGRPVRILLPPHETRDRYHRLLGYIELSDGETMLNEELIRNGLGYADRRFDHVWRVRFTDLEKRARQHAVGLWAGLTIEQMPAWRQRYQPGTTTTKPSSAD